MVVFIVVDVAIIDVAAACADRFHFHFSVRNVRYNQFSGIIFYTKKITFSCMLQMTTYKWMVHIYYLIIMRRNTVCLSLCQSAAAVAAFVVNCNRAPNRNFIRTFNQIRSRHQLICVHFLSFEKYRSDDALRLVPPASPELKRRKPKLKSKHHNK